MTSMSPSSAARRLSLVVVGLGFLAFCMSMLVEPALNVAPDCRKCATTLALEEDQEQVSSSDARQSINTLIAELRDSKNENVQLAEMLETVKKDFEIGQKCLEAHKNDGETYTVTLRTDSFSATITPELVQKQMSTGWGKPMFDDLLAYTGLSAEEVTRRLERVKPFHFDTEFNFWAPKTDTEMVWYYKTSVSYLFGNAMHKPVDALSILDRSHGPVLDFSGGVGNNVMSLLARNISAAYFGIGQQEFSFAEFRVQTHGYQDMATFIKPYYDGKLDPVKSVPDMQFGAILAFDVFEHIPDYEVTLAHLVSCLRPGGLIFEQTPFASSGNDDGTPQIHVPAKTKLSEAMAQNGMHRVTIDGKKAWQKTV